MCVVACFGGRGTGEVGGKEEHIGKILLQNGAGQIESMLFLQTNKITAFHSFLGVVYVLSCHIHKLHTNNLNNRK